jgi:predicted ester cyclase
LDCSGDSRAGRTLRTTPKAALSGKEKLEMSIEEEAKAVVRSYVAAFNAGDLDRLRSLLAEDAEIQGVLGQGQFEKVAPIWRQLIEGYGMQLSIQGLIAEGNVVAARYIETGKFRAPAFGNEPTGQFYELVAMEWFEIESGRIKRRWGARDAASQARQLGIPLGP